MDWDRCLRSHARRAEGHAQSSGSLMLGRRASSQGLAGLATGLDVGRHDTSARQRRAAHVAVWLAGRGYNNTAVLYGQLEAEREGLGEIHRQEDCEEEDD